MRQRLSIFYNSNSIMLRLYDPMLHFKHDKTIYFNEIRESHKLITKQLLAEVLKRLTSDKSFIISVTERLLELVLPDFLTEFQVKYYCKQL